ncbi:MAG: NADH-quinone oxidoreductase subunit NuoH [Planctomycetota bacterium]|nr:NADH-quinone oxidoreductase subunit NuoH [Planctomycetota bacterium]
MIFGGTMLSNGLVFARYSLAEWIQGLLGDRLEMIPEWILFPLLMLAGCLVIIGFITVFALFAIWMERKVSAHMQCRLGPMEVGFHGALQTIADGVKLLGKEDIVPRHADKLLHYLAPIIVFAGVFPLFVVVPFSEKILISDINLGLFFVAAVGAVEVVGVIMAGWASNNKWSLFGAMRAATQLVSYEIPLGLAFLTIILLAGSFSMVDIIHQQEGWLSNWFLFHNPFMPIIFLSFFTASLAECKRAPFDLPEAESELVSGFHTEYSGMKFSIFFLAEYAAMYVVCAIAAVMFLGGWSTGIKPLEAWLADSAGNPMREVLSNTVHLVVIVTKSMFLVFVQMWLRWTLPRIRLDQIMHVCLKVLLPWTMVAMVATSAIELCWPGGNMVLTALTIVIWSIPLLWTLKAILDMTVGIFLKFVPSGR